MLLALKAHPENAAKAVDAVTVAVTRTGPAEVTLVYEVTGDVAALVAPEWTDFERADELWRSTCFEVFVRAPGEARYFEFNASPSGQWAGYGFDGYREGMRPEDSLEPWGMERSAEDTILAVSVELNLGELGLGEGPFQLGLSAVIEDVEGGRSYWALAHPSDKPDFHHPESFVLELS